MEYRFSPPDSVSPSCSRKMAIPDGHTGGLFQQHVPLAWRPVLRCDLVLLLFRTVCHVSTWRPYSYCATERTHDDARLSCSVRSLNAPTTYRPPARGRARLRSYATTPPQCAQAGHWEQALSLLADMRRQGVRPSRVTYTAAVAGLDRPRYAGWGPKLAKLARLLQQRPGGDTGDPAGVEGERGNEGEERNGPSPEDFDSSIEALGDAGDAGGAACLLRVMRQEGFNASPRAYRSVIYALARLGHLAEAITLAKEMGSCCSSAAVAGSLRTLEASPSGAEDVIAPVGSGGLGEQASRAGGVATAFMEGTPRAEEGIDALARPTQQIPDDGVAEDWHDGTEFAIDVVYNCIVCNFARAATETNNSHYNGGGYTNICENRGGSGQGCLFNAKGVAAVGGRASAQGSVGDGGLVARLLGVTERAEWSLAAEAANGGVHVSSTSSPRTAEGASGET